MDTRTPTRRRFIMRSVKTKNTGPELIVRRLIRKMRLRHKLNPKDLPGKPDIVLIQIKKVIFVHGCFWHGHLCRWGQLPKSNLIYWKEKIKSNKTRDTSNRRRLRALGWKTIVVWQCQLKSESTVFARLERFVRN
ncbi:MAG TPA: DNA mismatch endonuclease Vsr [Gammaproteobacteria bacterium]|nr:DNA mismatch endonuclease Vsr [Gammaproteobacteria bacterium]